MRECISLSYERRSVGYGVAMKLVRLIEICLKKTNSKFV
jgi:hypothetical protein